MLSEKAITEFKKIWEEVNPYKEIEDQELLALANKVF